MRGLRHCHKEAVSNSRLPQPCIRGRRGVLKCRDCTQTLRALPRTSTVTLTTPVSVDGPDGSTAPEPPSRTERPHICSELQLLLRLLPPAVRTLLETRPDVDQLVEVVMDLGRRPSARFPHGDVDLSSQPMTADDLQQAMAQVGRFDGDNRAGIDSTLHRISCIRNRAGRVVGLTCRVGRAVPGAAELVRDLVMDGRSVLLLGRPGVGKTTALREVCRIAADESGRRVVVVDTSNEIGGDGDVPHPSIGGARRMQVPRPEAQHAVMVEAVENHMPQVVVIDEISTAAECAAARTIAQRGVQLVATAHGNQLQNVLKNPTLADLVGGIQSVTLGDEEAKRRGVQKSILERAGPPTFDVAVEMEERGRWRVHLDVGTAVDAILAGGEAPGQVRFVDGSGQVTRATFMGTVRRTDSSGAITTSEWWADESGEREEPLLWPLRQDVLGQPSGSSDSSASAPSAPSSSATSAPSGPSVPQSRVPSSPGSASSASSFASASATSRSSSGSASSFRPASASQSAATRSNTQVTTQIPTPGSASGTGASNTSGFSGSNSSSSSSRGVSRDPGVGAAAAPPPPRLRALLVMDDEAAARVRAVLGLLKREAYEAAVALAGGAQASAAADGGMGEAGRGGSGGSGSESLIELVPDLDMADLVIGTKSKLRNSPKIRNAARKRQLPVYALTATSTSALLRNLCPLLGLDPLAVAEVVRAGRADGDEEEGPGGSDAADQDLLGSASSVDEDVGEDGEGGGTAAGGQRRSLELSAADDYAELLATTVRELRYAPLDRSYAQHVLGRFVDEMMAASAASPAGDGTAPAGAAAPDGACAANGSSGAAEAADAVRANSLAAVAWACSFVKHRKKFVEASRKELQVVAEACGRRWGQFTGPDLLRVATGFAGMRLAPPSREWLQGLTAAAQGVLGEAEAGVAGVAVARAGTAGATTDGAATTRAKEGAMRGVSAEDASRLQLALAELELLLLEAERQ